MTAHSHRHPPGPPGGDIPIGLLLVVRDLRTGNLHAGIIPAAPRPAQHLVHLEGAGCPAAGLVDGWEHSASTDPGQINCPPCASLAAGELPPELAGQAARMFAGLLAALHEPGSPAAQAYHDAVHRGEDPVEAVRQATARKPPPLDQLPGGTTLLAAATPGPDYEAWRHAAAGLWVAHPGARHMTADADQYADPAAAMAAGYAVPVTAAEALDLIAKPGG